MFSWETCFQYTHILGMSELERKIVLIPITRGHLEKLY